jgi:hypothetical protein
LSTGKTLLRDKICIPTGCVLIVQYSANLPTTQRIAQCFAWMFHVRSEDGQFIKPKHIALLVCFTNHWCVVFDCLYLLSNSKHNGVDNINMKCARHYLFRMAWKKEIPCCHYFLALEIKHQNFKPWSGVCH